MSLGTLPIEKRRASVPGPGRTVYAEAEKSAVHIRTAVAIAEDAMKDLSLDLEYYRVYGSRWAVPEGPIEGEPLAKRAAWALVSTLLLGRSTGALESNASLRDGERWFIGNTSVRLRLLSDALEKESLEEVRRSLAPVRYNEDFGELLPYILDPHGPGSRLSVRRDPRTQGARSIKRRNGVFYTPADVAEFMADELLRQHGGSATSLTVLDPACGTGVFLRAMLRSACFQLTGEERFRYASERLFGIDISPIATQSACFVLLHDCLVDSSTLGLSPWTAWQRLRLNLAAVDAIQVIGTRSDEPSESVRQRFSELRNGLNRGLASCSDINEVRMSPPTRAAGLFDASSESSLSDIFPTVRFGFDLVIGNPPYAHLAGNVRQSIVGRFESISERSSVRENLFPLFIELTWLMPRPKYSASALVVPLSIAYHTSTQMIACRRAMMETGGEWRLAFFDREPHALFGEDVKTRNAIIFHRQATGPGDARGAPEIHTTSLIRWTSRSRARLFGAIKFALLGNVDISAGIPKVGSPHQASAARQFAKRKDRLVHSVVSVQSTRLEDALQPPTEPTVFIASTAYNFLNVFRPDAPPVSGGLPLSENPVLALRCDSEASAAAVFAILSSRLVFWWWLVKCDGFHVPRWFLQELPFDPCLFSSPDRAALSSAGSELWSTIRERRLISLNGGRRTLTYRPFAAQTARQSIDSILLRSARISPAFIDDLDTLLRNMIGRNETDGWSTEPTDVPVDAIEVAL